MKAVMIAAVAGLLPVSASAFIAENRLQVNPLPNGGFEVIGQPGSGPAQYWCAAGDYALRVLGAGASRPVYMTRGIGAPVTSDRKSAIQFSLSAPEGGQAADSLTLSLDRVGDRLSVAFASNYCLNFKNLDF